MSATCGIAAAHLFFKPLRETAAQTGRLTPTYDIVGEAERLLERSA